MSQSTLLPSLRNANTAGRPDSTSTVRNAYAEIRQHTDRLCAALTPEDQCVQSMPDASPAKWHRAHTTWFFEEFVLRRARPDYAAFDQSYRYLFNSYYENVGPRHPRPQRGLLTRPGAAEIDAYRTHVDQAMLSLLAETPEPELAALVTLGLHHEQQHQELLITDTLHAFAHNPLSPAVLPGWTDTPFESDPADYVAFDGGIVTIGVPITAEGFAFDNEGPAHRTLLEPYRLAARPVTNREFLAFMDDGGYATPTLWMSDGWAAVQEQGWSAPLHWREGQNGWTQMGPGGLAPLLPDAAVRHVSWYEADAFARWAGGRLPTEQEWEAATQADERLRASVGAVWEWTASAYRPYPGFRAAPDAMGEYNGKFMINQMVLRGSSAATPPGHTRLTYRNFFHPDRRWQFSGLRLADDV
ncbi:MAG TPA: ergothioneine biosynthesis protein EgtB [Acidisphaera sp.]|nr:ergothioneine biosynthesis protein EgtB [Acidisphaera sp.]